MQGNDHTSGISWRYGPHIWLLSAGAGTGAGWQLARVAPGAYADAAATAPAIGWWLVVPFGLLLLSIALMPLRLPRIWHRHFPDFAFFLGALVVTFYLRAFARPGYDGAMTYAQSKLLHAGIEYFSFIALVGGLYVVSGGILVRLRGRTTPLTNTMLLIAGAILANVVGTTGASVLLIRPFLRANEGRIRPLHIVFFIFIVSNCGGSLTPIGDPPLYIGFLKGVPFSWTLEHLFADWAFCVGLLVVMFFIYDRWVERHIASEFQPDEPKAEVGISVRGSAGLFCLALIVAGVFIDPIVEHHFSAYKLSHFPYGATFQFVVAIVAYCLAPRDILKANEFTFFPIKEVGLLFLGIFATMMPALGFLSEHGARLGLDSPTRFYFGTGIMSAVLDNAPTYLNFLQIAVAPADLHAPAIQSLIATPTGALTLDAISTGAVFFGAMTYIGNGPNFMVRSIAEAASIKMPTFFPYIMWACLILLPVLVLHWAIFIR